MSVCEKKDSILFIHCMNSLRRFYAYVQLTHRGHDSRLRSVTRDVTNRHREPKNNDTADCVFLTKAAAYAATELFLDLRNVMS